MATIRDVARESGVSVATVSYVLNDGPRPVREKTRRQVLDAMKRLGYHPNGVARALVSGKVHTLGILFGSVEPALVTNAYVTGVLQGILTAAAERGYNVTLITRPWEDAARSAAPCTDGRTDGLLIVAPLTGSGMVDGLARLHLPLVVVSAATDHVEEIPFVDVDNVAGARLAAEHLLALGHRRIAHVAGEAIQPSALERRQGFCEALAAAGVPVRPDYLVASSYDANTGYEDARRLLTLPERPTALFAANDGLALAAVQAGRDLGMSIPEELSIIGFDDLPMASLVTPALTTIRQPLAEIGERATRMLIARIEGDAAGEPAHRMAPELVVRGTTAPAPA